MERDQLGGDPIVDRDDDEITRSGRRRQPCRDIVTRLELNHVVGQFDTDRLDLVRRRRLVGWST